VTLATARTARNAARRVLIRGLLVSGSIALRAFRPRDVVGRPY
jgi:hypothetical protein